MREIGLIILNSIKNNLRLKIALMIYIAITIICVLGLVIAICVFLIAPEMNTGLPDRSKLELYLGLIMYSTCFISLGVNLNAFATQSMTREKSRGNIESLLATPLEAKNIWIAKSIAIFIPGLILGEVLTFIVLIAVNYIYFIPEIGFILNPWLAVSSFLVTPLIYLFLSLLFHLVALTGKPATGNVIIQVFLPVAINLIINLVVRNILVGNSWQFTVVNLGIAFIIAVMIIFLKPHLKKERIVLSR